MRVNPFPKQDTSPLRRHWWTAYFASQRSVTLRARLGALESAILEVKEASARQPKVEQDGVVIRKVP